MSVIDLIALAILAYNVLRGLASGWARSAFGLLAIATASALSWQHPEWGRPLVDPFFSPGSLAWGILQPIAIWAAAFLGINGAGILLKAILHKTGLGQVDRIGGAAMGFVSGILILAIPLLFLTQMPLLREIQPLQEILRQSLVVKAMTPILSALQTASSSL